MPPGYAAGCTSCANCNNHRDRDDASALALSIHMYGQSPPIGRPRNATCWPMSAARALASYGAEATSKQ